MKVGVVTLSMVLGAVLFSSATGAAARPIAPARLAPPLGEPSGTSGQGGTTSAVPTAPVAGPDPYWLLDVPEGASAAHAAVDSLGTTYLTSSEVPLAVVDADDSNWTAIQRSGPGSISGFRDHAPPAVGLVTGGDEGADGVLLAGWVVGSVTLDPTHDAVTIDGGAGTAFLLRASMFGSGIDWVRTFGAGAARPATVAFAGGTVVVAGELDAALTVDALTTPTAGATDAFAAGFDPMSGEATWVTELVNTSDAAFDDVRVSDGDSDADSVVLVGNVDDALRVSGGGVDETRACAEPACDFLVDLDGYTGEPRLVSVTPATADSWTTHVTPDGDGYAVLREDRAVPGEIEGQENVVVQRLDAAGAVQWAQTIFATESLESGADLAVTSRGDIVVTATFAHQARVGAGPAAVVVGTGDGGLLVVQYDATGAALAVTSAAGISSWVGPQVDLGIDSNDGIRLVSQRPAGVTVGTGPGARSLTGDGAFAANLPPFRAAPATFHPMTPTRLIDSRTTGPAWQHPAWGGKLGDGEERYLWVEESNLLPRGRVSAAVLNITVTDVTAPTYVVAWPAGRPRPVASNLNLLPGETRSNLTTVALGHQGSIQIANAAGSVHVVVDIVGYYGPDDLGDRFHPVTPVRVLDSRTPSTGFTGAVQAGTPRNLTIAGNDGVPADATAVTMSVTVTDTSRDTFLRVGPTGTPTTTSSNVNAVAGETVTNLVITPLGAGGAVTFTNNQGSVHVVADVVGYYRHDITGATFTPMPPARVLDSRTGTGGPSTPWGPGTIRTVPLDAAIPTTGTVAVAANLTATDTSAMSLLTLYPAAPRPATSNLLFTRGQTIAAAASTGVGPDGTVSLYNQLGTANLVLDINGYFTAA